MQSKQITTAGAVIVGLIFIVIAVLYVIDPAGQLPAFLPGHVASGGVGAQDHHTKHGILSLALAVCCFIAARFFWGPATDSSS